MRLLVFFLCLFFCGCAGAGQKCQGSWVLVQQQQKWQAPEWMSRHPLNFLPVKPECHKNQVQVQVHWIDPLVFSQKLGRKILELEPQNRKIKNVLLRQIWIRGLTVGPDLSPDHRCHIFAPRPEKYGDWSKMAILGHELLHCLWGAWHGGSMRDLDPRLIDFLWQNFVR